MLTLAPRSLVMEEGYHISEHGTIQDPGKFESCHWAAIPFYYMSLDGSDETLWNGNGAVDVFFVDDDASRDIYDLNEDTYAVTLYTSDSGFVYFSEWTEAAYEDLVARFEDLGGDDERETDEWSR